MAQRQTMAILIETGRTLQELGPWMKGLAEKVNAGKDYAASGTPWCFSNRLGDAKRVQRLVDDRTEDKINGQAIRGHG